MVSVREGVLRVLGIAVGPGPMKTQKTSTSRTSHSWSHCYCFGHSWIVMYLTYYLTLQEIHPQWRHKGRHQAYN